MNRRRLALFGALALVPLLGFGVTKGLLAGRDRTTPVAARGARTVANGAGTTTTEAPTTTTSAGPTTTTVTTLPPGNPATSPLPSIPRPGEPVAATDAAGLATQIRTAEAAIADASTTDAEFQRQAHIQQVAYRALVANPSLRDPTYALLSTDLRAVAELNVTAGSKLRSMIKNPKTSLPPWHIVEPAPTDELLAYYKAAQTEFGVPWYDLAAIHLVETRMGRIRGNSEANAQGPMQFLPATWAAYGNGGDINSNKDAIAAAARYLVRNGAPGDMRNAVWNYNHDYRYVDAVLAYGDRMKADERAYAAYHSWQVYYVTTVGDVWLPTGYMAS